MNLQNPFFPACSNTPILLVLYGSSISMTFIKSKILMTHNLENMYVFSICISLVELTEHS